MNKYSICMLFLALVCLIRGREIDLADRVEDTDVPQNKLFWGNFWIPLPGIVRPTAASTTTGTPCVAGAATAACTCGTLNTMCTIGQFCNTATSACGVACTNTAGAAVTAAVCACPTETTFCTVGQVCTVTGTTGACVTPAACSTTAATPPPCLCGTTMTLCHATNAPLMMCTAAGACS